MSWLPLLSELTFGLLVASRNDPWMSFASARSWSERWGLSLYDAGRAGHINVDSGHGRWPLIRELIGAMQTAVALAPRVSTALHSRERLAYA